MLGYYLTIRVLIGTIPQLSGYVNRILAGEIDVR